MAKKEKCPNCKGSGQEKYHINPMDKDDPDYQPVYKFRTCKECGGKGEIKKEKR